MALTTYTADTNIIGTLGTTPEDRVGMTDQQLKDKFDENAAKWKAFFNATTKVEIDALITAIKGSGWTSESLKGLADLISTHTANISNPHSITASQVGLGNVNNTSDVSKPISTATQTALNAKAPLVSPAFTGTTPTAGGNMMYHAGNITISTAAPGSALTEGYQHQVY